MINGGPEGVLSGWWRHGSQRIVCGISASFSREVEGDGSAGGGVFGVIGPGIGSGFVGDIGGFKRDWRVAAAIQAFRALLADAKTPVGSITEGKDENGVVSRLRRGGTSRQLLFGRRILPESECGQTDEKRRCQEQSAFGSLRHADKGSPGR